MYSVYISSRVRRACLKDGMSARDAARYFNKDRKAIVGLCCTNPLEDGPPLTPDGFSLRPRYGVCQEL